MAPSPLALSALPDDDAPPPAAFPSLSPDMPEPIEPTNPEHRAHKRRLLDIVRRVMETLANAEWDNAVYALAEAFDMVEEMFELGHFSATDYRYRLNSITRLCDSVMIETEHRRTDVARMRKLAMQKIQELENSAMDDDENENPFE